MKNSKTTSMLVGLGLALGLAYGYAQGNPSWTHTSTNTFINSTGRAVGGLHIQYSIGGVSYLIVSQNPANTFADVQTTEGSDQVNLSSGTVAAGGSIQISVDNYNQGPIKGIRTWWWTDGNGNIVGQAHKGCRNPDCTGP
jgi:hypothetical protein